MNAFVVYGEKEQDMCGIIGDVESEDAANDKASFISFLRSRRFWHEQHGR